MTKIYIGQTNSLSLIFRLNAFGFGECTQRGEMVRPIREEIGPRRLPWFFDNGAWGDFNNGRSFDEASYIKDLALLSQLERPDFLVVPDLVAQGAASLAFSLQWASRLKGLAPLYLVTQDGQSARDVAEVLDQFDGVFVGGSLEWKIRTAKQWVALAHQHGKPCHIGRAGSVDRAKWALRIGADSLDSCLPLWSEKNLQRFLRSIKPQRQLELFSERA